MPAGAAAKALVVDGEDVDAKRVEADEGGEGIGERAAGAMEVQNGVSGIGTSLLRGNPPAVEARLALVGDVEADIAIGKAGGGGRDGESSGGVEEHLPLALIEKEAERAVPTDGSAAEAQEKGGEQPARTDSGGWFGCSLPSFLSRIRGLCHRERINRSFFDFDRWHLRLAFVQNEIV